MMKKVRGKKQIEERKIKNKERLSLANTGLNEVKTECECGD